MENRLPARAKVAVAASRLTGAVSRAAGRGSGAVIGGRVALKVDPALLGRLTVGREVVLVSATNGKTTTTRLISHALQARGPVASNALGANMPAGITAAMAGDREAGFAVLEVDEKYLPEVTRQTKPKAIALLNLSRDQLDRAAETRMMAQRWREGLAAGAANAGTSDTTVIANADDPLVVWAAGLADRVVWVAAGQSWKDDAWSCPQCGGVLRWPDTDWECSTCDFRRPEPTWLLDGDSLVDPSGTRVGLTGLKLPGRANRANATSAAAVAAVFGVDPAVAVRQMEQVAAVAGRYDTVVYRGWALRLLLAKNPAGWLETFDLLGPAGPGSDPVLLSVNALGADGTDTSWLWDVDYTRLTGRRVLVIGQRRLDLAVRLQVAGVEFTVHDELDSALASLPKPTQPTVAAAITTTSGTGGASAAPANSIHVIANYTAFQQLRTKVGS